MHGNKTRNWVIETRILSLLNISICDHMKVREVVCTLSIYRATFMSKMITVPEEYPKHALSPENDNETKSRL